MYGDAREAIGAVPMAGAALRGGYSAADVATAPMGRVTEAEQETRKLMEALQQALSHLESRISPILRASGPSGTSAGEKAQREPSAFASTLIANNQKLYALVGYVQDLSARVDL